MSESSKSQTTALSVANDCDGIKLNNGQERERLRTITAFFIFGTLIYATYSLVIVGAQDILAGTSIPTSISLIALVTPGFLVTLIAPYFMHNIPYIARIMTFCCTGIGGFLMLVFAKQVHWKLIGVGIVSFGSNFSEITILALSSFYHEATSTAFSAGTGVGYLIAPLYYTAMTTWACVSPSVTILIMATMLLLGFVCYYVMDKKHLESPSPPTDEHAGVEYSVLNTQDDGCQNSKRDDNNSVESTEENSNDVGSLSCQKIFMIIRQMLPGLISIYTAFFSEYMIIQSVVTTLAFPHAPFKPRDHYQYYIFVLMGGEVVGRSYLVALSYVKPEWAEEAKFPYLWVPSTIEATLLLFFVLAAWYRFLPSVWIVLLLVFASGAVVGVTYVNAVTYFRDSFKDRDKEFAMGFFLVAITGGVFASALLGLYVEPILREHCTMFTNNSDFCFTRSKSLDRFTSTCTKIT